MDDQASMFPPEPPPAPRVWDSRPAIQLRDAVLDDLARRRKALLADLSPRLVALARSRPDRTATADDCHDILADWPEALDLDGRWLGVVWRQGPWRNTGQYAPSRRPENHGRPIPTFMLTEGA